MNGSKAEDSCEAVYQISVRLDPSEEDARLFTLLLMDEDARDGQDRPLSDEDGYLVWFGSPGAAERALTLSDEGFRRHAPAPVEVAATYDFASLLWNIVNEDEDSSGTMVESLNFLLDLVDATGFPLSDEHRRTLFGFADHLTFSKEYASYFNENEGMLRNGVMDAVIWCIGAVTAKSRFFR